MLGRKQRGGSSASKFQAEDAGANTVVTRGAGQEATTVSPFDEAARERLDRMNRRLRLLEQQMETLEAEVGRASSADNYE
ncbi:unnamed protein product [Alopecurus aequalis]